jgi:Tol biopolymer transport system component
LVEDSTWQLFTLQPDGSRRRVLPQAQNLGWLSSCGPGGTIIAIKYEEDLKPTIWEVNVDSGEMKQVTHYARDGFDVAPSCGINGKSIVYILGTKDGLFKTMRVSSDGGEPVQLFSGGSWFSPSALSPDGKLFAQILPDDPFVVATSAAAVRLNLYSVNDGKLIQSFGWQAQDPAHRQMFSPRWTADGHLTFKGCTDLICQIYLQPLSEKPAVQLTNIGPSQHVDDFAWSPDGKKLAITLKRRNDTDAVVFSGIKPGQ